QVSAKVAELKNNKKIVLKSPTPDDAQLLLNHLKNIFHQSYQNMNQPKNHWDNFPVDEEVRILTDVCSSPSKFMISAFDQDKIVGNIGCFGWGGEFLKYNARIGMGLEKEYHNIGLGTALLNYAIENAKQNKIHRLELTVRTYNQSGIALYEKVGFQKVGILKEVAFIDGEFCDEYMYEMLIGK
ncbi:MAG: GNAT family N-acetyltransferase, partial [Bdellovibrio sp.]